MSEIKTFRITGRIKKAHLFEQITFRKDIAAAKKNHAIEKIYAEMGSRHRAKRNQIEIEEVEIIKPEKRV